MVTPLGAQSLTRDIEEKIPKLEKKYSKLDENEMYRDNDETAKSMTEILENQKNEVQSLNTRLSNVRLKQDFTRWDSLIKIYMKSLAVRSSLILIYPFDGDGNNSSKNYSNVSLDFPKNAIITDVENERKILGCVYDLNKRCGNLVDLIKFIINNNAKMMKEISANIHTIEFYVEKNE